MKKILITLSAAILLASCGAKTPETQTGTTSTGTTQTGTTQTGTTQTGTTSLDTVANGNSITAYYILRDTDENGEIIESNMDKDGNPTGSPLKTQVGMGQMIPGFESAILGMKKGETKAFSVSPEQAYGTGMVTREIIFEDIAPVFTVTENKDAIVGKTREQRNISEIPEDQRKIYVDGKNPGDVILEKDGLKATLVEKTDTTITVELENSTSPFYGKEIKVGTTATITEPNSKKEIIFTVTKVEGDNVTLEVKNTISPFTGKEFAVGATAQQEENGKKIEYKIISIDEKDGKKVVNVEMTNPHNLANKTLHFTVKIDSISEGMPALNLPAIH